MIRTKILTSLFSVILFSIMVFGQSYESTTENIVQCINKNDSKNLAGLFNSTVDLEIGDTDGSFSQKQSELIVRDFFKNSPVKTFSVNHQGSSNDGSRYLIGTYSSTVLEYRVYILLKKQNDKLLIHQLQFEED